VHFGEFGAQHIEFFLLVRKRSLLPRHEVLRATDLCIDPIDGNLKPRVGASLFE